MLPRKPSKWIIPDFDSDSTVKKVPKVIEKPKSPEHVSKKVKPVNWMKQFEPCGLNELAVNKTKVEQVQQWICVAVKKTKVKAPILLLSGPSGSAKTTTLRLLCKSMGIRIVEWITPSDTEYVVETGYSSFMVKVKEVELFKEFLLQARYPSLWEDESTSQITLIEDYPNIFLRDPSVFTQILEEYVSTCTTPLVFICTDSRQQELNISKDLFPDIIRIKLQITNISFNPVSATLMKTAIAKWIEQMLTKNNKVMYKSVPQNVCDSILNSSNGDIRNALINLHFAALQDSTSIELTQILNESTGGKTRKRKNVNYKLTSLGCDESVDLMHGLGRVFYPKKVGEGKNWKFSNSPDVLSENFASMPTNFVAFLHENYTSYFNEIDDATNALDALCDADLLLKNYHEKDISSKYALNLAIRSVMMANKSITPGRITIRGPKYINYSKYEVKRHPLYPSFCPKNDLIMDYEPLCKIISSH